MSRVTREQVSERMALLRQVVSTPIQAEYSIVNGGWRLQIVGPDNAKQSVKGFPLERVDSRCFFHLLNVAIATRQGELYAS